MTDVPCVLNDGECGRAEWAVFVGHTGETDCPNTDLLVTVCDVHKLMTEQAFKTKEGQPCLGCGVPIRLNGIDQLEYKDDH